MKKPIIVVILFLAAAITVWAQTPEAGTKPSQDTKQEIDQLPMPVGGVEAIAKALKYPKTARADSVQGTVYVEATVDVEGKVVKAVAQKGVREDLDKAALEAVKKVKFKPGMHKGKPVEAIVTIPIAFRLK